MKWTIDPSTLPDYIRIVTNGTASNAEVTSMWRDLLDSDYWRPGTPALFDNRELVPLPRDGSGIVMTDTTAEYFEARADDIGPARIAFLTRAPENYPLVRQFQIAMHTRRLTATLQMFYDEEDAITWLTSGKISRTDDLVSMNRA
jgi:hypothetical protein